MKKVTGMYIVRRPDPMTYAMQCDPLLEPTTEWWEGFYDGSHDISPPPATEEAEDHGQSAHKAD
jgi:hypothetical protein